MKNKTVDEIEDMILDKAENWWDVYDIDNTDDGYISAIYLENFALNLQARIVFPCGATNFYFLLQADYMDVFSTWNEVAFDCWYELDDLLENLDAVIIHEKVFNMYENCNTEEDLTALVED